MHNQRWEKDSLTDLKSDTKGAYTASGFDENGNPSYSLFDGMDLTKNERIRNEITGGVYDDDGNLTFAAEMHNQRWEKDSLTDLKSDTKGAYTASGFDENGNPSYSLFEGMDLTKDERIRNEIQGGVYDDDGNLTFAAEMHNQRWEADSLTDLKSDTKGAYTASGFDENGNPSYSLFDGMDLTKNERIRNEITGGVYDDDGNLTFAAEMHNQRWEADSLTDLKSDTKGVYTASGFDENGNPSYSLFEGMDLTKDERIRNEITGGVYDDDGNLPFAAEMHNQRWEADSLTDLKSDTKGAYTASGFDENGNPSYSLFEGMDLTKNERIRNEIQGGVYDDDGNLTFAAEMHNQRWEKDSLTDLKSDTKGAYTASGFDENGNPSYSLFEGMDLTKNERIRNEIQGGVYDDDGNLTFAAQMHNQMWEKDSLTDLKSDTKGAYTASGFDENGNPSYSLFEGMDLTKNERIRNEIQGGVYDDDGN